MQKLLLFAIFAIPILLLSGCMMTRDVKTAVCIIETQPSENKCLEKLAIDTKDASPCDKMKILKAENGTILYPTRISCYSQVAFRKADSAVCQGLEKENDQFECKHRYELYVDAAKVTGD